MQVIMWSLLAYGGGGVMLVDLHPFLILYFRMLKKMSATTLETSNSWN